MEQKNILFFLMSFNRGGAEWVITNLCNEMVEIGHSVTVVSLSDGNMFHELDPRIKKATFNGKLFKAIAGLRKMLQKGKYDALFTTQRLASTYAFVSLVTSFTRTRFIVREAASNFKHAYQNKNFFGRIFWKSFFRISYNYADLIIVNSLGTKNDLITAGIFSSNKSNVYLINNPLDLDKIKKRAKQDVEDEMLNKRYIISVGRLVPKKNMDVLIKAYSEIKDSYPDMHLVIVGDGPEKKYLMKLIQDTNLQDKVLMTGDLENPYPYIGNAEIFVLASRWEGFGMVIVEALCLGIPVISSDIDAGPRQILDNGEFGTLIEADSVQALKEALIKNIDAIYDREKLINRADFYGKSKITKEYLETIFG